MKSALADYLKKSIRTWANYATTDSERREVEHFREVLARGELEWDNACVPLGNAVCFAINAPVNEVSNVQTQEVGSE